MQMPSSKAFSAEPQKEEGLGVSSPRVIRMKPGSHESINPMNRLDVRVAANLENFVLIVVGFHFSLTACTTTSHARKSLRYRRGT
jgi:hypothetical protein